jgi:hypothetical protein
LITEANVPDTPPNRAELNEWADEYGQTFPVLSDALEVVERYSPRGTVSLPSVSLLAPGAEILIADGDVTEADIISALP